ncbi:threonine efflux protein [Parasedimentitalea maritima]|uniref:Threonine efflux protein n=1 Tax=Parasedimentitalea maritima TaxID=2578117 RepID=A0A6A4RE04_9RHOB|nr:threonine efflux protein [Zongyanglinia marina]
MVEPQLFNSPLEAGLRVIMILEAFSPKVFDLATLSLLDYFVVHTGDAGGPISIHPELEARAGEYFVRRRLVEEGVALMVRSFILEQIRDENGISYRSRETAAAMIDLMSCDYNTRLRDASEWLARKAREDGLDHFIASLRGGIERWTHEVTGEIPL